MDRPSFLCSPRVAHQQSISPVGHKRQTIFDRSIRTFFFFSLSGLVGRPCTHFAISARLRAKGTHFPTRLAVLIVKPRPPPLCLKSPTLTSPSRKTHHQTKSESPQTLRRPTLSRSKNSRRFLASSQAHRLKVVLHCPEVRFGYIYNSIHHTTLTKPSAFARSQSTVIVINQAHRAKCDSKSTCKYPLSARPRTFYFLST